MMAFILTCPPPVQKIEKIFGGLSIRPAFVRRCVREALEPPGTEEMIRCA
jgi:hypothetical protein